MDKYEYNLKLEEIDKLVDQGDYEEAAKLADTIEWKRVRNVRTLCLISEIYEASGRLDDSKTLLVRAYRKAPVGKTILYRLVEVTTALQQYDEALEYYTEYVQAAPHDNNRYILKYMIYRGRGSSVEELITILEEYLGQEYTERWAYELATLYQQAGHMQKCFAACDDLVLWFHSGKYVCKALELKKRYTSLTPRQQQIYEECLQEEMEAEDEKPLDEEETVLQSTENIDGEVIAETIMAQTEKQIAEEIAAHKAQIEREAEKEAQVSETDAAETAKTDSEEPEHAEAAPAAEEPKDLKVEFAKSMREIIAGVVKRTEANEEDIPASVDSKLHQVHRLEIPEAEELSAGQLSIDDILLSMGEKGKKIAAEAMRAQEEAEAAEKAAQEAAEQAKQKALEEQKEPEFSAESIPTESMTEAAAKELTEAQREALQYTSNPEKLLRNKSALPTYAQEQDEDLGSTRIIATKEELMEASRKDILSEKTIRIPAEEISNRMKQKPIEEPEAAVEKKETAYDEQSYDEGAYDEQSYDDAAYGEQGYNEAAYDEQGYDEGTYEEQGYDEGTYDEQGYDEGAYDEQGYDDAAYSEQNYDEGVYDEQEYDEAYDEYDEEEYLTIPSHLRNLFSGFTEIEGLEDQIANAIIQAAAKGDDKTSRTGNILIFGAHGSGKTTLAMNIAKAVAQDKGNPVMKMAKIYAADLNRKDIAATIARIAGGTLIIEEAGDLEPNTVEQLTTAMEFRTDGLIVILEDEQQYIHELLMRHPRFTMKFTSQIYIPVYTAEELAMFGQIYAKAQDYVISEDALDVLYDRISELAASGNAVAISEVINMVSAAIVRSNKFFRKMAMGKKRFDENDYVILFPKDFK